MEIHSTVFGIFKSIYDLCEKVTANRASCFLLKMRAEAIELVLRRPSSAGISHDLLCNLRACLQSALDLIREHVDCHLIKEAWLAATAGDRFDEVHTRLSHSMTDLNISVAIRQEEIEEARKRDATVLQDMLLANRLHQDTVGAATMNKLEHMAKGMEALLRTTATPEHPWRVEYAVVAFDKDAGGFMVSVGAGGGGSVYRGNFAGKPAALKVLHVQGSTTALQAEASAYFRCRHRNIVAMYGAVIPRNAEEKCVIILEHIEGVTLGVVAADPCLESHTKLAISIGIIDGLVYLHSARPKTIHGDLKPMNIMIRTKNSQPVLIDLGSCKELSTSRTFQTNHGGAGSAGYKDPDGAVFSAEGDMYAFGLVLFELWTGSSPWPRGVVYL